MHCQLSRTYVRACSLSMLSLSICTRTYTVHQPAGHRLAKPAACVESVDHARKGSATSAPLVATRWGPSLEGRLPHSADPRLGSRIPRIHACTRPREGSHARIVRGALVRRGEHELAARVRLREASESGGASRAKRVARFADRDARLEHAVCVERGRGWPVAEDAELQRRAEA